MSINIPKVTNPIGAFVAIFAIVSFSSAIVIHSLGGGGVFYFIIFIFINCVLLGTFLFLLFRRHALFFGPSEIGQENYKDLIAKQNALEFQMKSFEQLPMMKYVKLHSIGQEIALGSLHPGGLDLDKFVSDPPYSNRTKEVDIQLSILIDDYRWCEKKGKNVTATERGIKEMSTFLDFVYARMAPEWWRKVD